MRKDLGRIGEKIAYFYLLEKGYKILETNFQRKWGEIDIVAKKNDILVFVEVKTLKKPRFHPEESITFKKKRKLFKNAQLYLIEKNYPPDQLWQIDIIAVEILKNGKVKIFHTENIF